MQKPLLWWRVHLKVDIARHIYVKTWFQLILLWSMAKKIYREVWVWFILGMISHVAFSCKHILHSTGGSSKMWVFVSHSNYVQLEEDFFLFLFVPIFKYFFRIHFILYHKINIFLCSRWSWLDQTLKGAVETLISAK